MGSIQLSDDLLNDIQQVLQKHDADTQDVGVGIQYLSAVIGLLLARFPGATTAQKQSFLKQLYDFSQHVLDENLPAEEKSGNDAFGIWKPDA